MNYHCSKFLIFLWLNVTWKHSRTPLSRDYSIVCCESLGESSLYNIPSVHFSSVAQSCPTLCDPMDCSTPGFPVHHQLLELAQTHVHWVDDAIQPSDPLSSPFPPSFNLSQNPWISRIRWPEYWSFSFGISPSSEYSGLISFTMDWLDLLAVQGTLKSLLQQLSSKASILRHV